MDGSFLAALLLTTLAGLSTVIGSILSVFYKNPGPRHMAFMLGFSAGVMVLVSFVELLGQGVKSIGFGAAHIAFFSGMFFMFLIDLLLPHIYMLESDKDTHRLKKTSLLIALGVGIHNLPEGMVTLAGALKDINIGITLAVAIAIHNIPEGIAVSAPIYALTKNVRKAFLWSFLSGMSEPVGALVAGLLLMPFLSDSLLGFLLPMVGGFMVFISLDELLPVAHSYNEEHVAILGIITGMMVMAGSLWMLG